MSRKFLIYTFIIIFLLFSIGVFVYSNIFYTNIINSWSNDYFKDSVWLHPDNVYIKQIQRSTFAYGVITSVTYDKDADRYYVTVYNQDETSQTLFLPTISDKSNIYLINPLSNEPQKVTRSEFIKNLSKDNRFSATLISNDPDSTDYNSKGYMYIYLNE